MRDGECGRRRRTECRGYYVPVAAAPKAQRSCGPACRRARRRRLSRARRASALETQCEDDAFRRCKSRAARTGSNRCHAPPSPPKCAEFEKNVLDSWDGRVALSRATLERRLPGIVRAILRSDGTARAPDPGMARATLGSETAGMTEKNGRKLGLGVTAQPQQIATLVMRSPWPICARATRGTRTATRRSSRGPRRSGA